MHTTPTPILSNQMDATDVTQTSSIPFPFGENEVKVDFSDVLRSITFDKPKTEGTSPTNSPTDTKGDDDEDQETCSEIALVDPLDEESSGPLSNAATSPEDTLDRFIHGANAFDVHQSYSDIPAASGSSFKHDSERDVQGKRDISYRAATSPQTIAAMLVNGAAHHGETAQKSNSISLLTTDFTLPLQNNLSGDVDGGETVHTPEFKEKNALELLPPGNKPLQKEPESLRPSTARQKIVSQTIPTLDPLNIAKPAAVEQTAHHTLSSIFAQSANPATAKQSSIMSSPKTHLRSIVETSFDSLKTPPQSEVEKAAHQPSPSASAADSSKHLAVLETTTRDTSSLRNVTRTLLSVPEESTSLDARGIPKPEVPVDTSASSRHTSLSTLRAEERNLRVPTLKPDQTKPNQPILAVSSPRMPTALPSLSNIKLEPSSLRSLEAVEEFAWDLRPQTTSTSLQAQTPLPARHEIHGQISQQLAHAMHRNPDRPVEIALNPTELGRVRMTLTTTDAGIVVSILADRPETLDLIRRNISELGESFSDLGYDDIAFSFGQNDDPSDESSGAQSSSDEALMLDLEQHENAIAVHPDTQHSAVAAEGIDLRL